MVLGILGATCLLTGIYERIFSSQAGLSDSSLMANSDKIVPLIRGLQKVALQSTPAQQQQIYALLAAYRKHLVALKANADQGK
jgi:hypothetical protein